MPTENTIEGTYQAGFENLISDIRTIVLREDKTLLDSFDIYAQEARFSRFVFDSDIKKLKPGASILEIGAGMMLLSCQLKKEGFNMTALEPFGDGFSHFAHLQRLVKNYAAESEIEPIYLECGAEEIKLTNEFDYAFSSNVMEHVGDVGEVLAKVTASLKANSIYRFICPNYAFPYEPHFNMPTLGSKRLTERMMWKRIKGDNKLPDPIGTWKSLNWITPKMVKRICHNKLNLDAQFNSNIFIHYLQRSLNDPLFQQRRGKHLSRFMRLLNSIGIFKIIYLAPIQWLPVMDCSIISASPD